MQVQVFRQEEGSVLFRNADGPGSGTLLEAAEKAGVNLDHMCRDGLCGACAMTLERGKIEHLDRVGAYISDNEVLPCSAKAKSPEVVLGL